ncbi:hypothetical protein QE152_g29577 [Popillia japonica]|uniref:HTH CENPB-type domain-containing protein n=1 Tax=Popillia japonica TaxID=7064 RepID=A0AAW1JH36_POPJA
MWPDSLLSEDAEKKIVICINKLHARGFISMRLEVRRIAFHLAAQLKMQHKFDRQAQLAGYDWLSSFLRQHLELSIGKVEASSRNRSVGMDREVVAKYFELLPSVLDQHQLLGNSDCLYYMDETGLQQNNNKVQEKPGANTKKEMKLKKLKRCKKSAETNIVSKRGKLTAKMVPRRKQKKNELVLEESTNEDLHFSIHDSSSDMENINDATCTGCREEYIKTTRADDWIPKYVRNLCKIAH